MSWASPYGDRQLGSSAGESGCMKPVSPPKTVKAPIAKMDNRRNPRRSSAPLSVSCEPLTGEFDEDRIFLPRSARLSFLGLMVHLLLRLASRLFLLLYNNSTAQPGFAVKKNSWLRRLIPFDVAHFFDLAGLREGFVPSNVPAEVTGEKALADAVSLSGAGDGPEVGQEFLFGDLLPLRNNVLRNNEQGITATDGFAVKKGGDGFSEPLFPGEHASVFHTELGGVLDLEGFEESAVEERVGHRDLLCINK